MKNKYKKTSNLKSWLVLLAFFFAIGVVQAQVVIDNSSVSLPASYVKGGDNVTATFKVAVSTNYTNLKLTTRVPAGWEIVSTSPVFDTGNTPQSAVISIPSMSGEYPITVTLKALCNATDGSIICSAKADEGNLMSDTNLGNMSNGLTPAFEFSQPQNIPNAGYKTTLTRTWKLKQIGAAGSYVYGNTIQVKNTVDRNSFNITKAELVNSGGTVLKDITSALSRSGLVYTYSFTDDIFTSIGNNDKKFAAGEEFYVKETFTIDECKADTHTSRYSYSAACLSSSTTYSSIVTPVSPYGIVTGSISSTNYQYPTSSTTEGFYVLKVNYAGTAANAALRDVYFTTRFGADNGQAAAVPITRAKVLDSAGTTEIGDAIVITGADSYGPTYKITWTGNGLTDEDADGVADDLQAGKDIYIKVYYKVDLTTIKTTCTDATSNKSGLRCDCDTKFFYTDVCGQGVQVINYPEANFKTNFQLNYLLISCNLDVATLIPGVPAGVTIGESSPYNQNNMGPWQNGGAGVIHVHITFPQDWDFAPELPVKYKTAEGVWNTLSEGDVDFSGGVLTLSIPSIYNGSSLSYNFGVLGKPNIGSSKTLSISHDFDWKDGTSPFIFSCYSQQIPYVVKGLTETCTPIHVKNVTAERTSYGFIDDGSLVRIPDRATALSSGIRLDIAGPYDNVEIKSVNGITGIVDLSNPSTKLNSIVSYLGGLGSDARFFVPYSVVLRYRPAGAGNSFQTKITETDTTKIISSFQNLVHTLTFDCAPYIGSGKPIPSLSIGDSLEIVFNVRVTPTIPNYAEVGALGMSVNISNTLGDCGDYTDHFFVYDYGKVTTSGYTGNTYDYWSPTASKGLMLAVETANKAAVTTDLFVNEYRPTVKLKEFEAPIPGLVHVNKVYDAYNYGIGTQDITSSVTVSPLNNNVSKVSATNLQMYSGELYGPNTLQHNIFMLYADADNVTCLSTDAFNNTIHMDMYPTSETPIDTIVKGSSSFFFGFYVKIPKVTLSSTEKNQAPLDPNAVWPVNIKIENIQPVNNNLLIPNCWLALEPATGSLSNIKIYESDGVTEVTGVQWETYGTNKYWVKLNNVQFTGTTAVATKNYIIKAAVGDGCAALDMRIVAKFAVNASSYPTNPEVGFSQYNSGMCGNIASEEWQLTLVPTEFGAAVNLEQNNVGYPEFYQFCDIIKVRASFTNSSSGIVQNLKLKVKLPPAYQGNDVLSIVSDISVANNWGDVYGSIPKGSVTKEGEYLVITVTDPTWILDKSGMRGDIIHFTFDIKMNCGFASGTYLYFDFEGKKACGDITSVTRATTKPVKIDGIANVTPVIDFTSVKLNTVNTHAGDGSAQTVNVNYTQNGEGEVTLSGTLVYKAIPRSNTYLRIDLPGDLVLKNTSADATANMFKSANDAYSTLFTQNGHTLQVVFDVPSVGSGTELNYNFSVTLKPQDPTTWSCVENPITFRLETNYQIVCNPGTAEEYTCEIVIPIKNWDAKLKMNKLDIDFVPGSVTFTERDNGGIPYIEIKGKIRNNSAINQVISVYPAYRGIKEVIGYNAGGQGTTNISIPANQTVDFSSHAAYVNSSKTCQVVLILPNVADYAAGITPMADANRYLCASDTIFPDQANGIGYRLNPNVYTACEGASLSLVGTKSAGYTYLWNSSVGGGTYFDSPTLKDPKYTFTGIVKNNQTQTLTLRIDRPGGCYTDTVKATVKISPSLTTWTGSTNSDWNNEGNWDNGVPVAGCTNAIIPPVGITNYPNLDPAFTPAEASCDTIIFNAETDRPALVAKTYKLNYKFARVNLKINQNRWYTLSAPLREMVSGDYYAFNRDPNTTRRPDIYMMKYQQDNPQLTTVKAAAGKWSKTFSSLAESLTPGMGYSVWFDGAKDGYGTSIPTYGNEVYFAFPSKSSSYNVFDKNTGAVIRTTPVSRTESNIGKFIYEGLSGWNSENDFNLITDNSGFNTILVGNPFMSYLDFNAFYAKNPGLDNRYYIWTGSRASNSTFDVSSLGWATNPSADANLIAPMQSFVVSKAGGSTSPLALKANWNMSVVGSAGLRSAYQVEDALNLELLRDNDRNSAITLVYKQGTNNSYDSSKDVYTLFNTAETKPAVLYSLVEGKAVSIRTIGDLSQPVELGITTSEKGALKFKLTDHYQMDSRLHVILEDRMLDKMQDLSKDPIYAFTNETGNVTGRFFLKILGEATGIENVQGGLCIYSAQDQIHVSSDTGDLIHKVEVYNVQGQLIYKQVGLNTSYKKVDLQLKNQIVVVRAYTGQSQKTEKILLK